MGVVKRQGIKQSIVRYFGLVLGAINVLFLYPLFLGDEKIGLINFILSTTILSSTFAVLGVGGVTVKFFPFFKNEKKSHNGFLTFLLIWVLAGITLFFINVLIFRPLIIDYYSGKSSEYLQYLPYVIPLVFFVALQILFKYYISNFNRIVIPSLLEQLYKIVLPILAMLFFYKIISFDNILKGIIAYYVIHTFCLMIYTYYLGQLKLSFDFSFFDRALLKDIATYAGYGLLGTIGSALIVKIDIIMVASLGNLSDTGVYSVALFIATIIQVPNEAINNIAAPIISTNFVNGNFQEIESIYKKASIILWTLGLFFLIVIWSNVDSLFAVMPNGATFAQGKFVILILGIGMLIDLLTSVNGLIIGFSPYYRFNFYVLILLAVLNIAINLIFIPLFGINGAAMATTISLFLFNIIKLILVYYKFGVLPFSIKTIYVFFIALFTYYLVILIPSTSFPILDIVLTSSAICFLFISSIIYFDISDDITTSFWQVVDKIKIAIL